MSDAFSLIEQHEQKLKRLEKEEVQKKEKRDKLLQQKAALEKRLKALGGNTTSKKRRERNHKLILAGALVEMAGMIEEDRGYLLGVLLTASGLETKNPEKYRELKEAGDRELDRRRTAGTVESHK